MTTEYMIIGQFLLCHHDYNGDKFNIVKNGIIKQVKESILEKHIEQALKERELDDQSPTR